MKVRCAAGSCCSAPNSAPISAHAMTLVPCNACIASPASKSGARDAIYSKARCEYLASPERWSMLITVLVLAVGNACFIFSRCEGGC